MKPRTAPRRAYKQSAGSSGFSPARTSVQPTERISLCSYRGGPLGGSWSGLPWLSYTSRGREPKIRFLPSSPRRASWCLESRLTHCHGFPQGQSLLANHILLRYLKWRLRYIFMVMAIQNGLGRGQINFQNQECVNILGCSVTFCEHKNVFLMLVDNVCTI